MSEIEQNNHSDKYKQLVLNPIPDYEFGVCGLVFYRTDDNKTSLSFSGIDSNGEIRMKINLIKNFSDILCGYSIINSKAINPIDGQDIHISKLNVNVWQEQVTNILNKPLPIELLLKIYDKPFKIYITYCAYLKTNLEIKTIYIYEILIDHIKFALNPNQALVPIKKITFSTNADAFNFEYPQFSCTLTKLNTTLLNVNSDKNMLNVLTNSRVCRHYDITHAIYMLTLDTFDPESRDIMAPTQTLITRTNVKLNSTNNIIEYKFQSNYLTSDVIHIITQFYYTGSIKLSNPFNKNDANTVFVFTLGKDEENFLLLLYNVSRSYEYIKVIDLEINPENVQVQINLVYVGKRYCIFLLNFDHNVKTKFIVLDKQNHKFFIISDVVKPFTNNKKISFEKNLIDRKFVTLPNNIFVDCYVDGSVHCTYVDPKTEEFFDYLFNKFGNINCINCQDYRFKNIV